MPASPLVRIIALCCSTLALRAEPVTVVEPFGLNLPDPWLEPAAPVGFAPERHLVHPLRAEAPAAITFLFTVTGTPASLSAEATVQLHDPGDRIRWLVSWDNQAYAPVADWTWQRGDQTVDLSDGLTAGRPLYVRIELYAAREPGQVGFRRLAWTLDGIERVDGPPRMLRSAWLYPAWSALTAGRVAPGLPPGRAVAGGRGRLTARLKLGPTAADWITPPSRPDRGRARLLLAPSGPRGGRLTLGETSPREHDLPYMPLGALLDPALAAAGSQLLVGAGDGSDSTELIWLETGLLELRHLRPRLTSPRTLRLETTVVNHGSRPITGSIRLRVIDPTTGEARLALAGYRFPPGGWLAPLILDVQGLPRWRPGQPATVDAEVRVDDQVSISDAVAWPLGLRFVESLGEPLWLDGQALEREVSAEATALYAVREASRTGFIELPETASREALDEADRLGQPVVIVAGDAIRRDAAEMLAWAHPAVLAVRVAEK